MNSKLCVVILFVGVVSQVYGHGRVMDPPSRGSMWRFGYNNYPVNYDDNANFCGGFAVQEQNGGKCGLCGDDYSLPQPRPMEHGGIYGLGVISKRYQKGGVLEADVEITASHLGHFEFSICNMKSDTLESEECFEKYPLSLVNGSTEYKITSSQPQHYKVQLQLPNGLTCEHCVFRWHYHTGNNWGVCEDGTGAVGCGPQETFRTCSDIAIDHEDNRNDHANMNPGHHYGRPDRRTGYKTGYIPPLGNRIPNVYNKPASLYSGNKYVYRHPFWSKFLQVSKTNKE